MDYKTMKDRIEDMVNDNHKDFVKAIISMEKGINDESALDKLYDAYMDKDTVNLLHEEFDYMIEDLREQGQIKDLPYVQEEFFRLLTDGQKNNAHHNVMSATTGHAMSYDFGSRFNFRSFRIS